MLLIDVTPSEEFMKEMLHSTKDRPLARRDPFGKIPSRHRASNAQRRLAPALPSVCERVAKARGVWGVPKRIFA
jgi:hypothetical protein